MDGFDAMVQQFGLIATGRCLTVTEWKFPKPPEIRPLIEMLALS